jgi:methylase of polypeptide subunit release factors
MTTMRTAFGPLCVEYDDHVLAPRPWTVLQSRHATAWLEHGPEGPIIELHCGAGQIGQATAAWSGRELVQVDDDPAACAWARHNAQHNAVRSDVWCRPVEALDESDGSFALVLADPPYVRSSETNRFHDDPGHAIDGGPDGLSGIRACLPAAARLTASKGAILLQVRGLVQAAAVGSMLASTIPQFEVRATVTVSIDRAVVMLVCD